MAELPPETSKDQSTKAAASTVVRSEPAPPHASRTTLCDEAERRDAEEKATNPREQIFQELNRNGNKDPCKAFPVVTLLKGLDAKLRKQISEELGIRVKKSADYTESVLPFWLKIPTERLDTFATCTLLIATIFYAIVWSAIQFREGWKRFGESRPAPGEGEVEDVHQLLREYAPPVLLVVGLEVAKE